MEEERLDEMIRQTLEQSRRPPEPPLDAMWAHIESRAFAATPLGHARRMQPTRWLAPMLAAAAALVIGVGLGWYAAPRNTIVTQIVAATPPSVTKQDEAPRHDVPDVANTANIPSPTIQHTEVAARNADTPHAPSSRAAGDARFAAQFNDLGGGAGMSRYLAQTAALLSALPSDRAATESDTAVATRAGELLTQTHLLLDSQAGSDPTLHRLLEDLELVLAQVSRLRGPRNAADLQLIHQALTVHDVLPRVHDAAVEAGITD